LLLLFDLLLLDLLLLLLALLLLTLLLFPLLYCNPCPSNHHYTHNSVPCDSHHCDKHHGDNGGLCSHIGPMVRCRWCPSMHYNSYICVRNARGCVNSTSGTHRSDIDCSRTDVYVLKLSPNNPAQSIRRNIYIGSPDMSIRSYHGNRAGRHMCTHVGLIHIPGPSILGDNYISKIHSRHGNIFHFHMWLLCFSCTHSHPILGHTRSGVGYRSSRYNTCIAHTGFLKSDWGTSLFGLPSRHYHLVRYRMYSLSIHDCTRIQHHCDMNHVWCKRNDCTTVQVVIHFLNNHVQSNPRNSGICCLRHRVLDRNLRYVCNYLRKPRRS